MKLGILVGSILPLDVIRDEGPVPNAHGMPSGRVHSIKVKGGALLLLARHGMPPTIPPHRVDHKANVMTLKDAGAEAIVSVCSAGALKEDMPVPVYAVPDDYIDLFSGATSIDGMIRHMTPELSPILRGALSKACREKDLDLIEGGTYVQVRGPRLETVSEIRLLSSWGDYVGMNMGPEVTLSMEFGLPTAGLLSVENLGHGLRGHRPDYKEILSSSRSRWSQVLDVLGMLPTLLQGKLDR